MRSEDDQTTPELTALDADVAELRRQARTWVTTPLRHKRELLDRTRVATAAVAEEWVRAACEAKGLAVDSPAAGEEWMTGPYAMLSTLAALSRTVGELDQGVDPLKRVRAKTMRNGQIALRVFPFVVQDLVLIGYSGEVWLRPGVTLDQARAGVGNRLTNGDLPGEVGLVLGAGNINSIPPLDALSKLYQDNAVTIVKLNPVNAYLEPIFNEAFAPFIEQGFVRFTAGGADVGSHLVNHPDVDTVHITGSRLSHDAIVFGPGPEGERRRAERKPLVAKPITSELGGVGPVVVVPGEWDDAALKAQAENVATQRLHNSGFNCIATQMVVLPESWPAADRFIAYLRDAMRAAPSRPAYYPGAADRRQIGVDRHPTAESLGGDPATPRTLLLDVDPDDATHPAFCQEFFGPVIGVTRLPGSSAAHFLANAVDFCNERLLGDLGCSVIASPATVRELGPRFDDALTRLRYGTVAVNCWVGPVYAMPRGTWGAYPGHEVHDVGSGIGVVHNALLLDPDHVERSVGRGPFRPWPKPVWFVGNRTAHRTGEFMTRFMAKPSLLAGLPDVAQALWAAIRG